MHVAGVNRDARTFEHIDPVDVGADRRVLVSELSGKGTVTARADVDDATAARVVERVKELEHRGYQFEAADGSFDLLIRKETGDYEPLFRLESWRAIVEKRADGRVETEATIKIWVDGERYVRTAEGNGPVHALDRALRDAIGERYPHLRDIQLVNFKVRILDETKGTGAVTRVLLDASDGTDNWGAIGVSENIIEASWEALVDSLEAGMLPHAPRARRERLSGRQFVIPLAKPLVGRREEELVLQALRSGRLALGPYMGEFEERLSKLVDRPVSAVSSGTAGLHLAIRAAGIEGGDEVVTTPFSFVASANCLAVRERKARLLRHRSAHAQHRPRGRRRGGDGAHDGVAARPHLRLPGRHARARDARGRARLCGSSRTPARRSARDACGWRAGGRARQPRRLRLLPEQADHDGGGRRGRLPRRGRQGAHRLRAQPGPRPGHGLARPRPARLQLPPRRPVLRAGGGPARAHRRAARGPRTGRGALLGGARRTSRGSTCPARTRTATGAPGSSTPSSCRPGSTATPPSRRCASAASRRSRTCRRST